MVRKLLVIALLSVSLPLFSQPITLDVMMEPYPTPYIADWTEMPGIFTLTGMNNSGSPVTVDIRAEIHKDGELLGEGVKRNIQFEGYGTRNFDNIDFLELQDWDYEEEYADNIIQSGRLPEGQYEICFSYPDNHTVTERSCGSFEIVIPEIPDLIEPVSDVSVEEIFPRYEWTPAFVPAEMGLKYRLRVCLNEENEDPNYSITKVPLLNTVTENNFLIYSASSPPLEEGKMYVWQVQLLDRNSHPLGENEGKSEIGRFIYGSEDEEGAIYYVHDGIGADIDWYNSPLINGNWDGEGEDFYYALGSEPGNTDLYPWTYSGGAKSFTLTLNLEEGTTFYTVVKVGEFGEPVSSDGCVIDLTPPESAVDTLADSLQTPFEVTWSGSDSLSGIQQYVIQRKTGDSSYTDWITVEDTTTSKSFHGEVGKTYYFRSRATDLAGNEESYPDSADAGAYVKEPGDSIYVLVPNVSYLRITDSTEVEEKEGKTILKGQAKLIIESTPFNNLEKEIDLSDSTICDSTSITFEKNVATNALEPIEGNIIISDTSGLKDVYEDVLRIVTISFKSKRPVNSRMMVDSAFITFPFDIPSANNTNLVPLDSIPITAAGLAFTKELDKSWAKWGLTFTMKDLSLAVNQESAPYIQARTHVKFNKKSKKDTADYFATNATLGFRGKNDIYAHIVPDSIPMQLIPKKDYVMLDSIWFAKPDNNWKLGAALQFKYPKPLDNITDQSKVSILVGDDGFDLDLALINEKRDSTFDSKDKTALKIHDYVAVDLTNVNLKLQSVNNNGKTELSDEHSYVEFMADLYLGEKNPKRIAVGDPDENKSGFKVTFDGNPQAPGIAVKDNPFDIGPVRLSGFTDGSGLGVSFDPFEISLSGGIGINKPGTFEGTVNFENLVINKEGLDFSGFEVRGGDVTVMDVITASIDSIGYSAEPTTLTFAEPQGDTTTTEQTIEVDSYFRLAGTALELNIGGDGGGGGCEEFLLYEVDNATNVIIREAWFEVKNTCRLTADLKYMEQPEPLLSFSGSAEIESADITGVALGQIGQRGGLPTFGIFMAASGINANLGYVTLNDIGGGFFYRPLQSDIDKVKDLVGLKKGSLMKNDISAIVQNDMPPSDDLTFAIMLYAGIYVQSKEVCEANGLITLTDNYFELLAKAKMLEKQANGDLQLLVSWDPAYGEGHIGFRMEKEHAMEIDQTLEFFAYSREASGLEDDIWAIMGNGNVKVFPSTVTQTLTTDFFVGPPGFYFDVDFEKGYDFWIIDGSYGYGTMFWWEQSVSWGAYAQIHGSLNLDHVAGVGCGLEGALIGAGNDVLIYSVGSFSVKFLGETVYSGSIWVSLGTNGMHGDRGRNSTYDGYIESAKNMADDMKDEIDDMSNDIAEAKQSAMELSDEQRIAAGEALYRISGDTSLADIMEVRNHYRNDMYTYDNHLGILNTVYNDYIFFDEVQQLQEWREDLAGDSLEIRENLSGLNAKSDILIERMRDYKSQVSGTLPQVAETIALSNPVDTGEVVIVTLGGEDVAIPANVDINTAIADQNVENTVSMQENITAYKDSMLAQADGIIDDLVFADSILYTGNVSVNSLSIDYYKHSHKLSVNTSDYVRHYERMKRIYSSKSADMLAGTMKLPVDLPLLPQQELSTRAVIGLSLRTQANSIPGENSLDHLIELRLGLINFLLGEAGGSDVTQPDLSTMDVEEKREYCITLGREVWYHIPVNGMHAIMNNTVEEINRFVGDFDRNRDQFYQRWGAVANRVEALHHVKSSAYAYLYDLYDAMSWEYEDGGPDNTLDNTAVQITQSGLQFGGQTYDNLNGIPASIGQGGSPYSFDSAEVPGGGQVPGSVESEIQSGQHGLLLGARNIGTAATNIRNYDTYSDRREYIQGISFPPAVKRFDGSFSSDEESYGYYGILSLDYEAEHSTGGCFYNVSLPKITGGHVSLGIGKKPSFYLFKPIDPPGSYTIQLTPFANTGYSITNSVNFPVDYYNVGYDEIEGGEYHTDFSSGDETKPLLPVFWSAYYSAGQDEISFTYHSDDPESGIAEYQYAIADSVWYEYVSLAAPPQRRVNIIRNWQSTGGRTENIVRGLSTEQNNRYYILGRAKNGVGMWSSTSVSERITVDKTPPGDFTIKEFQITSTKDLSRERHMTVTARWTVATDSESDVIYIAGLGTSEGGDDLIPFAPIYNNQCCLEQNFPVGDGFTPDQFHLTIKAVNTSGLSVVRSASFQHQSSKKGS